MRVEALAMRIPSDRNIACEWSVKDRIGPSGSSLRSKTALSCRVGIKIIIIIVLISAKFKRNYIGANMWFFSNNFTSNVVLQVYFPWFYLVGVQSWFLLIYMQNLYPVSMETSPVESSTTTWFDFRSVTQSISGNAFAVCISTFPWCHVSSIKILSLTQFCR